MSKFLDYTGFSYFWGKLKSKFEDIENNYATKTEVSKQIGDIGTILDSINRTEV
jgi:hypothetical protein